MYDMTLLRENSNNVQRIYINVIEQLLQSGKKENCKDVIKSFFDNINYNHLQSMMLRLYITMDIYIAAITFSAKLGISNDKFINEFGSIDEIEKKINTQQLLIDYFSDMVERCIMWRIESSRETSKGIIDKAIEYIESNYYDDEISLVSVANAINLSHTYFSSLFKRETGKNFVEYLSILRIEKSKELLCCTSMQISEIAYKVGFKDYRYFSQIFKKYTGQTPRDFQFSSSK